MGVTSQTARLSPVSGTRSVMPPVRIVSSVRGMSTTSADRFVLRLRLVRPYTIAPGCGGMLLTRMVGAVPTREGVPDRPQQENHRPDKR
jgi:hypothetical protein